MSMRFLKTILLTLFSFSFITPGFAQDGANFSYAGFKSTYDVTITNITKGQVFTPILITTHTPRISLFDLGDAASEELATVAESGNTAPLKTLLDASRAAFDVQSADFIAPGGSETIKITAPNRFRRISLSGMLIPTNDAFVALNSERLPRVGRQRTFFARAYDAGSEENDELCDSIPGPPPCFGEGVSAADGEGFVHVHSGIHGIGDLDASEKDWNNPVARITVRWTGFTR